MKIKKLAYAIWIALFASLVVGMISLSSCATNQSQLVQPAQIATIACPQLNLVHTQLAALNTALEASPKTADLGRKGAAQLAAIQPIVTGVCNGATAAPRVDFATLQTLVKSGLPALAALAASLPLPPAQQAQVQAALAVAETAASIVGVMEQQINAAHPAPAAAATVAPVPASTAAPAK